jgi:CheY-like chemotaxis protein
MLSKRGHDITVVSNGREAVTATLTGGFDVVLMDLQMPELGGLDATREIRAHEKQAGGHAYIIAMTAHALKGDRELCLEAGMDGYVTKPIDRTELFAAVEGAPTRRLHAEDSSWTS